MQGNTFMWQHFKEYVFSLKEPQRSAHFSQQKQL